MPRPSDPHAAIDEWDDDSDRLADPTTRICDDCVTDEYLWHSVAEMSESDACDLCLRAADCVTFDAIAEATERVIYDFYETFEESGAYHEDGETSEDTHDILDIAPELLSHAVDWKAIEPLTRLLAARNAVDYGFVKKVDLWASIYDFVEGDWHRMARSVRTAGNNGDEDLFARLDSQAL